MADADDNVFPIQALYIRPVGTLTERHCPTLVLHAKSLEIRWKVDGYMLKVDIPRSQITALRHSTGTTPWQKIHLNAGALHGRDFADEEMNVISLIVAAECHGRLDGPVWNNCKLGILTSDQLRKSTTASTKFSSPPQMASSIAEVRTQSDLTTTAAKCRCKRKRKCLQEEDENPDDELKTLIESMGKAVERRRQKYETEIAESKDQMRADLTEHFERQLAEELLLQASELSNRFDRELIAARNESVEAEVRKRLEAREAEIASKIRSLFSSP